MTSVASLNVSSTLPAAVASASQAAPANADAELAKYESQLSDWVHCESCKTSEGKAKIAEITDKIETIKTQLKRVEETKPLSKAQQDLDISANVSHRALRLDLQGTWLDAQA